VRTRAFNGTFGRRVVSDVMVAVKLNCDSGPGRKRGSPAVVLISGSPHTQPSLRSLRKLACAAAPRNDMG